MDPLPSLGRTHIAEGKKTRAQSKEVEISSEKSCSDCESMGDELFGCFELIGCLPWFKPKRGHGCGKSAGSDQLNSNTNNTRNQSGIEEKAAERDVSASSLDDDRISQLPQVLLQHIQYYMVSPKQAAQTVILSKAWQNTWSNRPNIDLNEFSFEGTNDEFLSLLDATLLRYHDHKLRIKDFRLVSKFDPSSKSLTLLNQRIHILIHMGVEKFSLSFFANYNPCCNLTCSVFEAESFVKLSLSGCRLDDHVNKVMFKHLKVLKLFHVHIRKDTVQRIISSCSLIENMKLEIFCEGLESIKFNNLQRLRKFHFQNYDVNHTENWFHVHNFRGFRDLKYLSLDNVSLSGMFHCDLSCYCPSLETLILDACYGFEYIKISSHSLKNLSLKGMDWPIKGRIDAHAPNISSFKFWGNSPCVVSFPKSCSKWTSDISLHMKDASSWFKLTEMLRELRQSEISLEICELPTVHQQNNVMVNFEPVEVEILKFDCQSILSSTVIINNQCLFSACHPKTVFVYWYGNEDDEWKRKNNEFAEYVCKTLMERRNIHTGEEFRQFCWQKDLKEASLSIYGNILHEWHPLQYETNIRKCAARYREFVEIQVLLKWT